MGATTLSTHASVAARVTLPTELDRAIDAAVEHLQVRQGERGLWHEPASPGPLHVLLGLLATLLMAPRTRERVAMERALLEELLRRQAPDGALAAFSGGPASGPISKLAAVTFQAFAESGGDLLEPAFRRQLQQAAAKAREFAGRATGGEGISFLELFADVVSDVLAPRAKHDVPHVPGVAPLARMFLGAPWMAPLRERVSLFTAKGAPALAVLVDAATARSSWVRRFNALTAWVPGLSRPAARQELLRRILENQGEQGAWLWNVFGTALNLLALRELGCGEDHPAVQRGVAFIERMRTPVSGGGINQSCCNSEVWDSCTAALALLHAGVSPDALHARELVETLLADQKADGLWAFGLEGAEGDVDSSTVVLSFLSQVAMQDAVLAARVTQAVLRCTRTFLQVQQRDGGFGYSPPPHRAPYGFGKRVPTGVECGVIDASTADVTGRILTALGDARRSGLLPYELRAALVPAIAHAQAFLADSQSARGSWFGRWSVGYLSSAHFVGRGVAALELDSRPHWVQRMRRFVTSHQNEDGGFGEVAGADWDPELAGRGPSTPVQTAYALTALLTTARPGTVARSRDLAAAARHLLERQERGTWANGVALYTHAFREDYYDAPLLTHAAVLETLLAYRAAILEETR